VDAREFAREIRKAPAPEDCIAWFGALLTVQSRKRVEVVGGSAIEIYLSSSSYVSEDIDLVGDRASIEPVLHRWNFRRLEGRSSRLYWSHELVGLVDLVGGADRSGLPPRTVATPHGPVSLSAPEPLIVRRLVRASREKSTELFRQAVELARLGDLDWEYLGSEARYEKVEPGLRRLRAIVTPNPGS
jgi:hypothetical protein